MSELAVKCIESWKKFCPDFEIKEWNESNFDLNCCTYVREAYEAKKWAFVTDYVRLYAMVTEGGVYMDTDVELLASPAPYLKNIAFSGFQTNTEIPTGIMACEKGFPLFNELLHDYDDRHFKMSNFEYDVSTNVETITRICLDRGLRLDNTEQVVDGFHLYPSDVFCAKDYRTGEITKTRHTVAIHHFAGSWQTKEYFWSTRIRNAFSDRGKVLYMIGRILAAPVNVIGRCKLEGTKRCLKYYLGKFGK